MIPSPLQRLALVATFLIAGCGGGSSSTDTIAPIPAPAVKLFPVESVFTKIAMQGVNVVLHEVLPTGQEPILT